MNTFQKSCEESVQKFSKSYRNEYFTYLIRQGLSEGVQKQIEEFVKDKLDLIPRRYNKSIFDYNLDSCVENAIAYWYSNPKKWLHLWGAPGKGKTAVAYGLYVDLISRGVDVEILNVGVLENKIKQAISKGEDIKEVVRASKNQILILDDLGVERLSEYNQEWIFDIVDYRYSNDMTTIFTSNLSLSELYKKYAEISAINAERLLSRIKEACVSHEFTNESYR